MTTNATSAAAARSSAVRFANGIPPSSLRDSEGSARSIGTVYPSIEHLFCSICERDFVLPMMTARTGPTVMLLCLLRTGWRREGLIIESTALAMRRSEEATERPAVYDTEPRPNCHNRAGRFDNIYILGSLFGVSAGFGVSTFREYILSERRREKATATPAPSPSLHEKRAACREACSPFPLGRVWPVGYAASSAASSVREVKGVVWPVATFTTSPSQRSLELAPALPSSALYTSVRTM